MTVAGKFSNADAIFKINKSAVRFFKTMCNCVNAISNVYGKVSKVLFQNKHFIFVL